MSKSEFERNRFSTLNELHIEVGPHNLDVSYNLDMMRRDILNESRKLELDRRRSGEFARNFSVVDSWTSRGNIGNLHVPAFVYCTSDKACGMMINSWSISKIISNQLHKGELHIPVTKEIIASYTERKLNEWWKHERTHVLQYIRYSPEEMDTIRKRTNETTRRNFKYIGCFPYMFSLGTIISGWAIAEKLNLNLPVGAIVIISAGIFGIGGSIYITRSLVGNEEMYEWILSPLEQEAIKEEYGEQSSYVFDVRI